MTPEENRGDELSKQIFDVLIQKLRIKEDWRKGDSKTIIHKTENIELHCDFESLIGGNIYLDYPDFVRAPFTRKGEIKKLVRDIMSFGCNQKREFVLDYMNGKYPNYVRMSQLSSEERNNFTTWLEKEVAPYYLLVEDRWKKDVVYFEKEKDYAYVVLKWL